MPAHEKPKPPSRRGGARPGAGAKPKHDDQASVAFSIRLPASVAAAIRERGLQDAVRAAIVRLVAKTR